MSEIQDWAYARTCQPCLRDHVRACTGVVGTTEGNTK